MRRSLTTVQIWTKCDLLDIALVVISIHLSMQIYSVDSKVHRTESRYVTTIILDQNVDQVTFKFTAQQENAAIIKLHETTF
jgi:hypothetical protein